MNTSGKIAIIGLASSALLAVWLLTGTRKEKTREFVAKKAEGFKDVLKSEKFVVVEDQEFYYI